ncbi:PAS domain-containing protein [Oxalobacteraceae bacterium GrIS 2.11]
MTDFDFGWDIETAKWVRQTDEEILKTGKPLLNSEVAIKMSDGRTIHLSGNRMPLFSSAGEATGIIGISVDITAQKEAEHLKMAIEVETKNFYDNVMAQLPCIVFWKAKDLRYVFCNEVTANFLRLKSPGEIVGMTDFDFVWDSETAKWIRQTDEEILRTGKPLLNAEFAVKMDDGTSMHLSGNRMPLFNSAGEVTGIIGISVDITAQKETELLKLENESQKAILQEQEKFKKIANQVAHDIRSPLSSMLMILQASDAMPERERIALRTAATRINDIACQQSAEFGCKKRRHIQSCTGHRRTRGDVAFSGHLTDADR